MTAAELALATLGQADIHLCDPAVVAVLGAPMHRDVVTPFLALQAAAREAGFELAVLSGFRGYERQLSIWNRKAAGELPVLNSEARPLDPATLGDAELAFAILRWSALPGASRHHWGTDLDVYDEALARSRESLKQCLKFAEKQRVTMALENVWNKLLLSPLELRDFVDGFRSRRVGVYFDTGNVVVTGYPEHWIRILGRRIARVHLKDFKWRFQGDVNQVRGFGGFAAGQAWGTMAAFCDLGAGDVNWPAVMAAFRKAGYRGPLTAEMLPPAPGMLERTSAFMDKLLAM